jgi:hypothetical protein
LSADAADLLKGDAGGAAAILGGVVCPLPEEFTWAKAVFDALEAGAEADIRNARSVMISTADLERMIPGSTAEILTPEEKTTTIEVLSSERFNERMPELRGVIRSITTRTEAKYSKDRAEYEDELRKGLIALEAEPDWTRLLDEDRAEIAAKLTCDLPTMTETGDPVRLLQTLLVRRQTLPGLVEELKAEIKRRQPAETSAAEGSPVGEEVVEADTLLQPVVISTVADLDAWVTSIREKLAVLLKSNKRIRIKGR